jgi:hypothetical protein
MPTVPTQSPHHVAAVRSLSFLVYCEPFLCVLTSSVFDPHRRHPRDRFCYKTRHTRKVARMFIRQPPLVGYRVQSRVSTFLLYSVTCVIPFLSRRPSLWNRCPGRLDLPRTRFLSKPPPLLSLSLFFALLSLVRTTPPPP